MEPRHCFHPSCPAVPKDPNDFYMLFVEGGSAPTMKHGTRTEALTEMERLARKTGKTVYILQTIAHGKVQEAPVELTFLHA